MRDVERDQIRQRMHRRVAEAGEILRNLYLELVEQHREFIVVKLGMLLEWIAGISRHKLGSETLHGVQPFSRHFDQIVFTAVGKREVAAVDADARALQRSKVQELRVIARHRLPAHGTKRRLHHAEHDRHVGDAPAHRTGCILTMRDRNNSVLRNQSHRRLETKDQIVARRADNRTIRFRPDGGRTKIRRGRRGRPGARSARIEAEQIWITRETFRWSATIQSPAACAPAVEGRVAAKICPLRKIRFPENHRASRAQTIHHYRVRGNRAAHERKRTGCRLHLVSGREVVLHQHRNAMEWSRADDQNDVQCRVSWRSPKHPDWSRSPRGAAD